LKPARILLTVAAGLGALYAAGLFYEVDFAPAGCCGLAWPGHDPAAAERLAAARDPRGLNAATQHDAAVAVLTARPAEPVAWVRLAYADWLASGGVMTAASERALDQSYQMAPYAFRQAPFRIAFALANWSGLAPDTRKAVLKEIQAARAQDQIWAEVRAVVRQTPMDPSGRLSAALMGLT